MKTTVRKYDKLDWHRDSAMEIYCSCTGKNADALADSDWGIIDRRAAAHIGLFIEWLISNDLMECRTTDELYPQNASAEGVRTGEITGTQYLLTRLDGVFTDKDVKEKARLFVDEYYDVYLGEYDRLLESKWKRRAYSSDGSPKEYSDMKKLIDSAYFRFREKNR